MVSKAEASHGEGGALRRPDSRSLRRPAESAQLNDRAPVPAQLPIANISRTPGADALLQLQRAAGNGAVSRMVGRQLGIQRKPADIDTTTTIHLKDGEVQEAEGEREGVSVALPVNKVSGAAWAKPAVDLKGGHLYKREFGGKDDYTNVVPWHADIEKDYTDKFENVYSRGWKANGKGGKKGKGPSVLQDWNLTVKASFTETPASEVEENLPPASPGPDGKEDPAQRKRFVDITRWSIDTIPASASASIEKVGDPSTKKAWAADPPKAKTAVGPNDDKERLRQQYDYAHSKPNFEGPLDGDAWIANAENKLKEGADK